LLDKKEEANLTPGMFLQAKIQLDPRESLAVPEEAIIEFGEDHYVLVQKSKTATGYVLEKVKVVPGAKGKQYVAIMPEQPLAAQAIILVKGGFNLL
jgi:cobalt-zinc-cadmium efflux system membrane fusion protein